MEMVHTADGDCDDDNPNTNPDASEYCDGVDNNYNGIIDEASALDAQQWYEDADGDSFGNPDATVKNANNPLDSSRQH